MRNTFALFAILAATTPAAADTFGGFSALDKPYKVNADKVCQPLVVSNAQATGNPQCQTLPADQLAKLDVKPGVTQSGSKATFGASASGRTLTVTRKDDGGTVTTWEAPDAISKVLEVYASSLEDRVAVVYTTRRAGRDFNDVVAFDLIHVPKKGPDKPTTNPDTPANGGTSAPDDPALTKALTDARKASGAKALPAWQAVLAIDAANSEALFRVAELQVGQKKSDDALATLETLAKNGRADAIEWQVEARFDKVFSALLTDKRFRTATNLEKKGGSPYERFMGFGGKWEQTGTSCDKATVKLEAQRDRSFKLRVKTACDGQVFDLPFHGTWKIQGNDTIVLVFPPNKGKDATDIDEAPCKLQASGDEDSLSCSLGHDLDFVVLPTRR